MMWISLAMLVAGCGVQRPLLRPIDIPAYEEQQRKKREDILREQRELQAIDAKKQVVPNATNPPTPTP
jgi:hypothetical protein